MPPSLSLPRLALLLSLALGPISCGDSGPAARTRELIERAESAVELRLAPRLRPMLADGFQGQGSLGKEETMALVTRYLLVHRDIHVLTRVVQVEQRGANSARAELFVALAAQPIDSPATLAGIDADILRLRVELGRDQAGELKAERMQWERATVQEMLLGQAAPDRG